MARKAKAQDTLVEDKRPTRKAGTNSDDNQVDSYLAKIQADFQKRYKDSFTTVRTLADDLPPTGILVDNPLLERILDRRFIAFGRAYLIYGKKGCSKTSLFLDFAKIFQQHNGVVIWVETERAVDKDYVQKQGVDLKKIQLVQADTLEQALTFVEAAIKNLPKQYPTYKDQPPVLICLDSIAGTQTEYEADTKHNLVQDTKVGDHAKALSIFFRKIVGPLSSEKCVFLALNQLKEKIGGFKPGPFAPAPEALLGGEAQRFHSTYQFKMDRITEFLEKDKWGSERKTGSAHSVIVTRNKLGREASSSKAKIEFDLYIDGGIDWYTPLVELLKESYKPIVDGTTRVRWKIPNTKYFKKTDDGGVVEETIDIEKTYYAKDLGVMISNSPDAKEVIREAFGIPPLPSSEEEEIVEKEHQATRTLRKNKDDELASDEAYE